MNETVVLSDNSNIYNNCNSNTNSNSITITVLALAVTVSRLGITFTDYY